MDGRGRQTCKQAGRQVVQAWSVAGRSGEEAGRQLGPGRDAGTTPLSELVLPHPRTAGVGPSHMWHCTVQAQLLGRVSLWLATISCLWREELKC